MSYITTYTGKHFDPVNPDASLPSVHRRYRTCIVASVPRKWTRTDFFLGRTALHCLCEGSAGTRTVSTSGSGMSAT